jgi:hypothetical protein
MVVRAGVQEVAVVAASTDGTPLVGFDITIYLHHTLSMSLAQALDYLDIHWERESVQCKPVVKA